MALNIGIIGMGQMGQAIDRIAQARGHNVVARIGREGMASHDLSEVDVLIEFTQPDAVRENMRLALKLGIPLVTGTTGWHDDVEAVRQEVEQAQGQILYASNFSLGVQLFFKLNAALAQMMAPHKEYRVDVEEIHHTKKKDAPSGTAVTIAEDILDAREDMHAWSLDAKSGELPIAAERIDPTPGTHRVNYRSTIDDLRIEHVAHNREGFALGAVIAAEKINSTKGLVNFSEII